MRNYIIKTNYFVEYPLLCMITGVPASGKTVLARELAGIIINGAYLSKDLIQSPFTSTERLSGEIYSQIQGPTFNILVSFAENQLSIGKIPIIDAPFSINHWRKDQYTEWIPPFKKTADKYNARLAIIRCVPPSIEELKRRIQKRNYEWDSWKLKNWKEFLEREPICFPIMHDDVYQVVTNQPVALIVKDILANFFKLKISEVE